jgi:hypothetical protein
MGDVTHLNRGGRGGPRDPGKEQWLRRQALQVLVLLPEGAADANRVMQIVADLLKFLNDEMPQG